MISATLYVLLGTSLIGVIAVLGILILRPGVDNTQLIVTVLGFLAPTCVALIDTLKTSSVHDLLKKDDETP